MATIAWKPPLVQNFGTTEVAFYAIPGTDTVVVAYYDGAGNIKVQVSTDGGNTLGAAVVVDATAGDNDVMLNEPIAYDRVSGRLHLCYGRNVNNAGAPAVLCHRYSDTQGATWSAEHVLDSGAGHGNNRFYRVGIWAANSVVSLHYTSESDSAFTTDGLWRTISTDGGATWPAASNVTPAVGVQPVEPNACGFDDGTVICSWYDPGVVANQSGDLWISRSLDNGQTWAAAVKLTTSTDYGRPRIVGENGTWWLVANKPWAKEPVQYADVYTLTSTDNGVTWGTPTLRGSHVGTKSLSHPDIAIQDSFVGILWNDTNGGHGLVVSSDGGQTFGPVTNPLGDATTSDAPRLRVTASYLLLVGYDTVNTRSEWTLNPMFAVQPQAQTPTLDTFVRAAENPLSEGGKWAQGSVITGLAGNALKTDGTHALRQSAAGTFDRSASHRTDGTFTGNVEAWVSVASIGGETDLSIGDPAGKNGYYMGSQDSDFGTNVSLQKVTAGAASSLKTTADATQAGDVDALQIVGSQVIAWQLRGGTLTEIARVVDTAFRASLVLGLDLAGNANAGDYANGFGGGPLSAPASSALPAITGATTPGSLLSVSKGGWTNAPVKYRYQWKRDGVAIAGAALPFYTVQAGDVGHTLTCDVTATNGVGAATATTAGVVPSNVTPRGWPSRWAGGLVDRWLHGAWPNT